MRLKDIREDRDLTQRELVAYLHIRQNTYSQYKNGQRSLPLDMLIRLAEFSHASADDFLGLPDVFRPYPRRESDTNEK